MLLGLALAQAYMASVQVFAVVGEFRESAQNPEMQTVTRPFWEHLHAVSVTSANLLLLAGAVLALGWHRDPARSRRWLLGTFGAYLPLQVLPRLVPLAWQFDFPPEMQEQADALLANSAPLMSAAAWIDLLPMVVSVFLGVMRAGLRHATIHPDRPLGPTICFTSALQLALLCATVFASAVQLPSPGWLLWGTGLVVAHFAMVATGCFRLARRGGGGTPWRWLIRGSTVLLFLPGAGNLLYGLLDLEVYGMHLLSYGDHRGLVQLSELPEHAVVFAARTISTALAANDLLARSDAAD